MLPFLALLPAQYDPAPAWEAFLPSKSWTAIASSADGFRLVASTATRPDVADGGSLYTSADGGVTWLLNSEGTVGGRKAWTAVASSADGRHLAGAATDDAIFLSAPVEGANAVYTTASDGSRFVASGTPPRLERGGGRGQARRTRSRRRPTATPCTRRRGAGRSGAATTPPPPTRAAGPRRSVGRLARARVQRRRRRGRRRRRRRCHLRLRRPRRLVDREDRCECSAAARVGGGELRRQLQDDRRCRPVPPACRLRPGERRVEADRLRAGSGVDRRRRHVEGPLPRGERRRPDRVDRRRRVGRRVRLAAAAHKGGVWSSEDPARRGRC